MDQELRDWLNTQLAKAEHAVKCREQGEQCWSGGTDSSWRAVAQAQGGVYHSKAKRMELAAKEKRIGDKCRKDVEHWKTVIALLEEKDTEHFHCRYCGAKSNKDCICGPTPL